MEHAVTGSSDILLQYGALGVLVIGSWIITVVVWKDNKALRAENSGLYREIITLTVSLKSVLESLTENVKESLRK